MANNNRNERMNKLNQAGINTGKYFNVELPNGLKPGATISLVINEHGEPVIAGPQVVESMMIFKEDYDRTTPTRPWPGLGPGFDKLEADYKFDQIRNQIIEDGYVRNTKLHRRFVMAQMFHMLNYVSYDRRDSGYNACLRNMYSYQYTLDMMLEEVRVLSKLETRDKESFNERSHFFTKKVVSLVLGDYLAKLEQYVNGLPEHKCKGVPYKRVKGKNIFVSDLKKKLYAPIRDNIIRVANAKSYAEMYRLLEKFMRNIVKLPYDTPKSKVWIDAYKGAGAYYTLKNLVMFHDCIIYTGKYGVMHYDKSANLSGERAIEFLEDKLGEYQGEYYKMFALMKKVIEDNNFNFTTRMYEIGAYE